jgi:ADP-ribose pyrophosphatase
MSDDIMRKDPTSKEMGSPDDCLARYHALRLARPDYFHDPADSPIMILNDDRDIVSAQTEEAARRRPNDQLAPDLRVGVLAADPYLGMLTRDAVRFADQSLGVYNRHIGEPGCVIMPRIGDRIVLIRIFRHATRDWAWEFPGGRISPDEDPEITALHELEEEIGAIRPSLQALGTIYPYPAFSSARIHLYTATIEGFGTPQAAEGILTIDTVSAARLLEMVDIGEIQDASAIACALKARLRGLI